jgi:hypothetical protein
MNPIQHVYVVNPWCCGGGGGNSFAATDDMPALNRGVITDKSGVIAVAGTSQVLAAANANRAYFFIQNISEDTLWINFGTDAVQDSPSIKLVTNEIFEMDKFNSTDNITIIGPNAGAKFVAKEG